MQKAILYGIIAAAAVAVAAGIGVSLAAMNSNNNNSDTGSEATTQRPSDPAAPQPKVIKHAMGETELAGTPARIVVVDGELAENLLTLEAQSSIVGASLWEIYGTSFEEEMQEIGLDVPPGLVNTGDYWAPNLELIAQIEPDVIVASDAWNRQNYEAFAEIAPTLMLPTYPTEEDGTTTLQEMEESFMALADAVGRQDRGAQVLESLHARMDDAASRVEAAGLKGHKFLLAEVWIDNGSPTMFLYTKNSVGSQVLERIGLQNALEADENSPWGVVTVGTEALASLDDPDLHFFFGHYDTLDGVTTYDTLDVFKQNSVVQTLEFVERDQVHELGHAFKARPTPRHMEVLLDKVLSALAPAPASDAGGQTRIISHAAGETEITGVPQRIIPLDTVAVELLLALGIEPVGAASLEDHKNWSPEISTKWPNVVDVGETWEPNFEVMAQLEPDLIIGMQAAHADKYSDLSDMAPTILLDNWPPEDRPTMLQAVEQNTMLVADILGRHDDGAAFLEGFNAKLDQNKRKLESAGLVGAKFILADVWVNEGEPRMRLYMPNAQGSETLERMGLQNIVPPPEEFQRFGNMPVSLEALAALDDPGVHFLYLQVPGEDPLTNASYWAENPVWKNLSFVKEGRVYPLGSINMFRGIEMLERLSDEATEALTAAGSSGNR